tara:strand:- start:5564 stop:7225 length:1662 start_codon:yes stop_codon:yes gene_type:complete
MPSHFTHYDDLFGPYLLNVVQQYDEYFFYQQIQKYTSNNFLQTVASITINIPFIFGLTKVFLGAMSIALISTFAPLQFLLTGVLILFSNSYESFLILSRLPSLIFSFLCLLMILKIANNFEDKVYSNIFKVTGFFFLTTSWMFLVYSSQGENFILGVLSILIIIHMMLKINLSQFSIWRSCLVGIFLSVLCLAQYQIFFFLPAFYIAILLSSKNGNILVIAIKLLPALLINLLSVILIYFIFLKERLAMNPGVHWNAGPNGEFLYQPNANNILESISYTSEFFFINSFKVLFGILGFTSELNGFSVFYVALVLLISVIGFFDLVRQKNFRKLSIFVLVSILTWIFLIVIQKLTFSPTRHSLALLPVVLILVSSGIHLISSIFDMKFKNFKLIFASIIVGISLSFYFLNFDEIRESRRDGFQLVNIKSLIKENNVEYIAAYGHTTNLNFFPYINNNFSRQWINETPYTYIHTKNEIDQSESSSFMIICANSDLCGDVKNDYLSINFLEDIKDSYSVSSKLKYSFEKDSNITNCFSNMAGSGKNRIFIKIFEIVK